MGVPTPIIYTNLSPVDGGHGGWDYNGTYFTPSTEAITAFPVFGSGNDQHTEVEFVAFDVSNLTYQQKSAIFVGDLSIKLNFTTSTSDPFDTHSIEVSGAFFSQGTIETSDENGTYYFDDQTALLSQGKYHLQPANSQFPSPQVYDLTRGVDGLHSPASADEGPGYATGYTSYYGQGTYYSYPSVPVKSGIGSVNNGVQQSDDVSSAVLSASAANRDLFFSFYEESGGVSQVSQVTLQGVGVAIGRPTLFGLLPFQATTDKSHLSPFLSTSFYDDAQAAPLETVTITLKDSKATQPTDADGTLSGPGLLTRTGPGTYKLVDIAQNLSADLQAIKFNPVAEASGSQTTVNLSLSIIGPNQTAGYSTTLLISGTTTGVPCYVTGSLVRTVDGQVPVETLARGDLVLNADGIARPVKWMGHRTIDPVATRFANPDAVMPIRIRAGALGDSLPVRDLLVSPDHAVLVGDILVQAGALVNGITVVRETRTEPFTYWHVELEDHDLIVAEGVAAETFVSNATRMGFDNWAEHQALYGDEPEGAEMDIPRVQSARQLPQRVRQLLAERVAASVGKIESSQAVAA